MSVWAVANQKGGVGKTTTAVTLASLLAERGHATVLVDLDPHASASAWLLGQQRPEASTQGVAALFCEAPAEVSTLLEATSQPGLSMLRATPALAALERRLATRPGMGQVLGRALVALRSRADHVVLDCPPTLGLLLVNALASANCVVIPVQTEHLALEGLRRMQETLEMIGKSQRRFIERLIVPTLFDPRTRAARDALAQLRQEFGADVWQALVPIDTRLRDASRAGEPPPMFCPQGRAVDAYRTLLEQLLEPGCAPDGVLAVREAG